MLILGYDNASENCRRYFEQDGTAKPEALRTNPWLELLVSAQKPFVNPEWTTSMEAAGRNLTAEYVMKTLDILDGILPKTDPLYRMIRTVLQWSETAKCGSEADRRRWEKRGYPLEIHNEASAMIYADFFPPEDTEGVMTEILIRTHGLAGQYVRGECPLADSADLSLVKEVLGEDAFRRLFVTLNECIIRGVSEDLWKKIEKEIGETAKALCLDCLTAREESGKESRTAPEETAKEHLAAHEKTAKERLEALLPSAEKIPDEVIAFFDEHVFPNRSLWYFQSALEPFGPAGAMEIARIAEEEILKSGAAAEVRNLSFLPLSEAIHYDFEGRRSVNVYRQRIIEKYLSDPKAYGEHVRPEIEIRDTFALVAFRFAPACAKLTEFCVEAERSGLLSYEKSIAVLYDMFGFRRDEFDRLSNEAQYLKRMNESAAASTKMKILDYVKGTSVTDVGSGGGILLDELEKRFPEKQITGTDISENVIAELTARKKQEGRNWNVIRHNFVDGPLPDKTDSVIFSSILHEIYSYTETENGRFDEASVKKALANAAASLNPGGRIIIRDGIKTPGKSRMRIRFLTDDGMKFFRRFVQDFEGTLGLPEEERIFETGEDYAVTDADYGREFLYTYTWGPKSYAHEVKERFGYFTIADFNAEFASLGMNVMTARSFLETGYEEHLSPLVRLEDPETGKALPFPDSTCIIVAEKPE